MMQKAMGKTSCFAAIILLITAGLAAEVCAEAVDDGREKSAAQQYFDAVAPEDHERFIKYHLDKGLEQRIPNYVSTTPDDFDFVPFQEIVQQPENFSINLLNHFESVFGLRDRDVYNYVKHNVVCTPEGLCFNPGDVGTICCPF
ncbi:uncharacterized protein LOC131689768 [Topomyia yanbarensis]|uniref:uncharacterized protein LOC131689768 n=1 Tax=Topomyia yanbarensis TaxID=2498891 RepID=UPI00273B2331|nr:uncharacterized protein LOC131689768 [Topomyia yanbarensis]